MRAFFLNLVIGVALFYHPFPISAEPVIEVTLDPHRAVTQGQKGKLTIQIAWPIEEGDYRFSQPELVLENLAIDGLGESSETFEKSGKEWRKREFRFELKAVRQGEGKIRPFSLIYVNPQTGEEGKLRIDALKIQIRPDRSALYRLLLLITAVMLGTSLATGGWLLLRRYSHEKHLQETGESSLEDSYLSKMNAASIRLLDAARFFRAYLAEKYKLTPGGFTNKEIINRLEQLKAEIPPNELKTLNEIFDKLDRYSFGHNVVQGTGQEIYYEMIRFVEGKKVFG